MIAVRKLLDFVFSEEELKILDDILPAHHRNEKLDKEKEAEEKEKKAVVRKLNNKQIL